jgi:hypothetical protein
MSQMAAAHPAQVEGRDCTQFTDEALVSVERLARAVETAPVIEGAGGAADAPVSIYARVDHANPNSD